MAAKGLRSLGRSGLRVSPLCLGAMNFGKRAVRLRREDPSTEVVHAYLDAGHNPSSTTANVYSATRSETIVGKAVKDRRDLGGHRDEGGLTARPWSVRLRLEPQARGQGL